MTEPARQPVGESADPPLRILIVEDEAKIARVVADYLRASGFVADIVQHGLAVVPLVRRAPPALILLDLMLPGCHGVEICKQLRSFSDVPVIMVTAQVAEVDRLIGLDAGADDYICKPFSPREVVARVRTVLRRTGALRAGQVARLLGPLELDEHRLQVRFHGRQLDLTVSEFRILRRLVRNAGRVLSRAQLLSELHGDEGDIADRAIDTHIKNIRKKMARIHHQTEVLRSVYGVGYVLDAT